MQFRYACLESIGYVLPANSISSDEIEGRLEPLYHRLRLPAGRLELITGVRERRLWPPHTLPSDKSSAAARLALEAADLPARQVGALIHASVCRDHLEPATACRVHHLLGLPPECLLYDLSNACLGILNGLMQTAALIELGVLEAGLVVGTESSGPLLDTTIDYLNQNQQITRSQIKPSLASLTIGSASVAILLTHRRISRSQNHILTGIAHAETEHHQLCQSGQDEAIAGGMQPLMDTDSEKLLEAGLVAGARAFKRFMEEIHWRRDEIDRSICHQVGKAHRQRMLEALNLPAGRDFSTVEWLGNTGSAALPVTMALAAEQQFIRPGDRVAWLGIGSGINSVMVGLEWQHTLVRGLDEHTPAD